MCIVPMPSRDVYQGETFNDDCCQPVKIKWFALLIRQLEPTAEEAIRLANEILPASVVIPANTCEVRRAVCLCRNEPEVSISALKLVDQVKLVVAFYNPSVGVRSHIADGSEDQHESG